MEINNQHRLFSLFLFIIVSKHNFSTHDLCFIGKIEPDSSYLEDDRFENNTSYFITLSQNVRREVW